MDKIINARLIGYFKKGVVEESLKVDLVSSMSCDVIRGRLMSMFRGGCSSVQLEFFDCNLGKINFSKQEYCTLESIAEFMYKRTRG